MILSFCGWTKRGDPAYPVAVEDHQSCAATPVLLA
jgi:hypothetical protein